MEAGSKFQIGRKTYTVVKVTKAMVLTTSGRRGQEQEHWFWKSFLESKGVSTAAPVEQPEPEPAIA